MAYLTGPAKTTMSMQITPSYTFVLKLCILNVVSDFCKLQKEAY